MEIKGKVIAVLEKKSGVNLRTGNAWAVQEYVLETHDQYPRKCIFDVFGEEKIKNFNIVLGDEITVHFDIDAREWEDKNGTKRWSNRISAWRVLHEGQQDDATQGTAQDAFPPSHSTQNDTDIPF